jgi:DNA-binding MarR family transcriptional regulator
MELFFTTVAFFIIVLSASYIFYERIKQAQKEYEESKEVVDEITQGFTRQLRRFVESIKIIKKEVLETQYIASKALSVSEENLDSLKEVERINRLTIRLDNTEKIISDLKKEVGKIAQTSVDVRRKVVEIQAPIPVIEENVLGLLTETEIEVLTFLEDFNEGSVPQIREKIGKTREHTARTLKKLYDKGFVDRNTSSMPYRYSVRKEMRELILQKKDNVQL